MITTIYFKENYSKFIIIYATENFFAVIIGWLFALAKRFFLPFNSSIYQN